MERQVGISAVVVIIALLIGGSLLGSSARSSRYRPRRSFRSCFRSSLVEADGGLMRRAWHALAAYLALAVIATWPLARASDATSPADLGDPVLVMWVLAWDCEQLLAILGGDFSRLATFFDANIFHPAR